MKIAKKLSSIIIALVVCSMLVVTAWATNQIFVTYSGTLDDSALCVNELGKEITLTISADTEVVMDGLQMQVTVPEKLKIVGIANNDLGFTDANYNLDNGAIVWYDGNADGKSTEVLATVTIQVPAGIKTGEYEITSEIIDISRDWGTSWEDGETITTKLTVGDHADGDDEDIACDYCGGKVACFDADNDGDHKCDKCGEENVTTCGDSGKDHICDTDSKCTVYSTGDNVHVDGEDNDHLCDYGCGKTADEGCHDATDDGDHKCDECENTADVTTCADEDKNHICDTDSVCNAHWSSHVDGETVNNKCEYCGGDVDCDVCTSLTAIEAKAPTCTDTGYLAYWQCACGKYYSAEEASETTKIADLDAWKAGDGCVDVDPTKHTSEKLNYTNNGETHSATYDCCGGAYVTNEAHDYTNGNCACGAEKPADPDPEEPKPGLKGDVDLNGVVDMSDFVALAKHIGEVEFITNSVAMKNADVTDDDVVDMNDFTKLAQFIGEIIDEL